MISFLTSESFLKLLTSIAILAAAIAATAKSLIELKSALVKLKIESNETKPTSSKRSPSSSKMLSVVDVILIGFSVLVIAGYFAFMPLNKFFVFLILFLWSLIILLVAMRFMIKLLDWIVVAFYHIHENLKLQGTHIAETKRIAQSLPATGPISKEPETAELGVDGNPSDATS